MKSIKRYHFLVQAGLLVFLGLLCFITGPWIVNQRLFGILAVATLPTVTFIGFGAALAISLYLKRKQGSHWPHRRLMQAIGVFYAILAIGGFINLDHWLGLFRNSLASTILYTGIATAYLYWGYFHKVPEIDNSPTDVGLPPMTQIEPQIPSLPPLGN